MHIRKLKLHFSLPIVALAVVGLFLVSSSNPSTEAQTGGCTPYYVFIDSAAPVPTAITGLHHLSLYGTTSPSIQGVEFSFDGMPLGRGMFISTYASWGMPWYTQVAPSGSHVVGAKVTLTTGETCTAPVATVLISNTVVAPMTATVSPTLFNAQTNDATNFTLYSKAGPASNLTTAIDVTPYTIFQKTAPSLGTITPLDNANLFHYSTGTVAGTTTLNVVAHYGGAPPRPIGIPVAVYSQPTAVTAPTTTTTSTTTPTTTTTTPKPTATSTATVPATTPTVASTSAASIESDPTIKNCAVTSLTAVRYQEISSGKSRPTAAEFEAINKCFATRNYILPTGFVPVSPDKVVKLPEATVVKIAGATNQTKQMTTAKVEQLKFAGKATPNSIVILYIHSEPLVLSTTADKNGDWSYTLEDPLEAGDHEAYAVVNKGDGTYQRSSVFDFVIAKAEASAANPKGYSLKIAKITPTATENTRSNTIYIVASFTLIGAVLATLLIVLMVRRKHQQNPSTAEMGEQPSVATTAPDPAAQPLVMPTQSPVIAPTQNGVSPVEAPAAEPVGTVVAPGAAAPSSSAQPAPTAPKANPSEVAPEERHDA